jgi:hypothetical protein
MARRIFFDLIFAGTVLFAPWWLGAIIGFLLLIEYADFFELVVAAFVIDTLFGVPVLRFLHFPLFLTLVALMLFALRRTMSQYLFNTHKAF